MKITARDVICPVLCGISLSGALLIASCGTPEEETEVEVLIEPVLSVVHAVEVTGFSFEVSPPDTVSVRWTGEGSGEVTDIHVSAGQELLEGDTVFQVREDLQVVERERLSMELDLASAMLVSSPADTLLRETVDSLSLLLDSLLTLDRTVYLSPIEGTVQNVLISADQRIRPGDAIAEISVASSELFHVYPPGGCTISSWPAVSGEIRFVEERPGYAVYSGELLHIETGFSGFLAVPREAVFESDLESYLITVIDDTISVIRAGTMEENLVIVLPGEPVTDGILTWTGR